MTKLAKVLLGSALVLSFAASAMADPAETTLWERNAYHNGAGAKTAMSGEAGQAMAFVPTQTAPSGATRPTTYGDPGRW